MSWFRVRCNVTQETKITVEAESLPEAIRQAESNYRAWDEVSVDRIPNHVNVLEVELLND